MRAPSGTTIAMGKTTLEDGNALILVDLQADACPGGPVAIPDAPAIVPVANRYLAAWADLGLPIVLSRCWHPPDHCSFQEFGGPWPSHGIADSPGAEFAPELTVPATSLIVSTGTTRDVDGSSAFAGTDLDTQLRRLGTTQVFIGGVATEHCVLHTVRDAVANGYTAIVLHDATRAMNAHPDDGARAEAALTELGVQLIALETLGL